MKSMRSAEAATPASGDAATDRADAHIAALAALDEPARWALYRYAIEQGEAISRDQAAEGLGIARHTAKFHLDKLVCAGLLDVEYRRPPGRTGPGAGRPTKWYRRSARELSVSLPARHYEFAGQLLAQAATESETAAVSFRDALRRVARTAGGALGRRARQRGGRSLTPTRAVAVLCQELATAGYEPQASGSGIVLRNCPFHALAQEHTDLVCGMNLDLLGGALDELAAARLNPELEPTDDGCCVHLVRATHADRAATS